MCIRDRDKTVIMIANRLSTVTNADQIYVLKDGKIAESGTHDALAAKDGIYTHMWNEYNLSLIHIYRVSTGVACSETGGAGGSY